MENWNISENRGGADFFLKLCQSLNFYQISKRMAPNCSEEQSPYRKISKKIPSPHIRGGGARQFSYQQFFRGKLRVQGLPPPLCIYIYFFNYFFYKGIALPNNLVPSILKSDKNWAIDTISKKTSAPPYFHHFRLLFWKKKNCSIFLRLQKKDIKLFRRAIPLHPDIKKIDIHHIRGGESPSTFISTIFLGTSNSQTPCFINVVRQTIWGTG